MFVFAPWFGGCVWCMEEENCFECGNGYCCTMKLDTDGKFEAD